MSEIQKSQFFKKLQHSQFQRRAAISKILTPIRKWGIDVRQGKMALLPYRQDTNASHVYTVLLKTYKNEFFKEYKCQQQNMVKL
jgi:hypothetical protein